VRRVRRASPGLAVGLAALLLPIAARAAPLVEAEPSRVVLGAGTQVRITVRGAGGALHGVASAGTLTSTGLDGAAEHFLWTPPEPRAPFVAVLAFWEGRPLSLGSVTTLTLPCSGRTELAIDTEPGARVTVEVAGAHFGPRRADARGHLRMPVEVAPLAHEARITAEVGDQGKVRVIPLATAPSPWVWALEPAVVDAGMDGQAMLISPEPIDPHLEAKATGGQLRHQATEPNRILYSIIPQPGAARVGLEASLPGEVIPYNEFYDYQDKYEDGRTRFGIPAELPAAVVRKIRAQAIAAFQACQAEGLARVDFFLENGTGDIYVNEINTLPGFTEISMYPKLWAVSGLPFGRLLDRLIELGLERHKAKRRCTARDGA